MQAYVLKIEYQAYIVDEWDEADRIYISKYSITSPLNKSKEKSIRYEYLFILHDLIEFYQSHNT